MLKTPAGDIPVFNNVREGLDAGLALQHRRRLPAALGRARRRGRADPRQRRPARRSSSSPRRSPCTTPARSGRWRRRTASTSSAATASASPTRGTGSASAGRSAATIRRSRCSRARSRSSRTRAASPPRSPSISRTAGWGTTTLVSSRQGRLHPLRRARLRPCASATTTARKAAVLYAEPGGYYEHGIDWTSRSSPASSAAGSRS